MKKLFVLGLILALVLIAVPVVADDTAATGNADISQTSIAIPVQIAGAGTVSPFNRTVADFSANVTIGAAPLTVGFNDLSVNATGWVWYFGDESYTNAWQQMNASDGFFGAFHNGAVAVPDGSIVYCPARNPRNETYRSTDNGATWQLVNGSGGWEERIDTYNSMVVLSDGTIVKMGGSNSTSPGAVFYNDTWISTDKGSTWQLVNASSGWTPRANTAAVALSDGSIVLTGGNFGVNNTDLLNDVWSSSDKGATWTQINASAGWDPRRVHAVVALSDDSIVLMGGFAGNNRNETWLSADKGYTWTQVNASSGWAARRALNAAAMPDDSIVVLGGITGDNTFLGDAWRSTDKGSTWTEVNSTAFSPRAGPSVAVTSDGSLVVMDGLYTNSTLSPNDVWRLSAEGSTLQNPSHTYTTPGTYQVTLQVYNADGYNSTRKTGYITVNSAIAPVANFTGTPRTGTGLLSVTFTDTSTNTPTSWRWAYRNATVGWTQFSTSKNPSFNFPTGTYDINLTATNTAGSDDEVKIGYINVTSAPVGMADMVGVFRPSTHTFYLRPSNYPATPARVINWGASTDLPVIGDWNGDGTNEVGVFRPSTHTFYLRPSNYPAAPVTVINWGASTDLPVTGDWNGDNTTEVGVFRPSTHTFYLRPSNYPAAPVTVINWGASTDLPVIGDWNGDGTNEVGVFRPSTHTFYLRPSNYPATPASVINWGASSDKPVTGFWS